MPEERTPDEIHAQAAQLLSFGVFITLLCISAAILKNLVF